MEHICISIHELRNFTNDFKISINDLGALCKFAKIEVLYSGEIVGNVSNVSDARNSVVDIKKINSETITIFEIKNKNTFIKFKASGVKRIYYKLIVLKTGDIKKVKSLSKYSKRINKTKAFI